MAKIAIDIDDNLYSFTDLAREIMYEESLKTGDAHLRQAAYAPWPEWRSPPDLLTGGLKQWLGIIDLCHSDEMVISRQPFDGAKDVCWDLWNEGHELLYISNRRCDSDLITGAWLLGNDFPVAADGNAELVCIDGQNKNEHLAECQYIIDDRPKNLIGFVTDHRWWLDHENNDESRVGFALQRPYNNQLTDWPAINIAPSWRGIKHYLIKEGVLSGSRDTSSDDPGATRVSGVAESVR